MPYLQSRAQFAHVDSRIYDWLHQPIDSYQAITQAGGWLDIFTKNERNEIRYPLSYPRALEGLIGFFANSHSDGGGSIEEWLLSWKQQLNI